MNEHKDDVYELNTRDSDKFDQLYQNKLMQFQNMLDENEKKAAKNLMQSRIVKNFNLQNDVDTEIS